MLFESVLIWFGISYTYTVQVMAEVNARKEVDSGWIIRLQQVYVDSTVSAEECKQLRDAAKECLEKIGVHEGIDNLNAQINGFISKTELNIKREAREGDKATSSDRQDEEHHEERHNYSFVLVFEFGDRTLHAILDHDRIMPGSFLAKVLLEGIARALESLHLGRRIHGDVKPLNIVLVGTKVKLIDLDISCEIGSNYGTKAPSSGYCPPELLQRLLSDTSKDDDGNSLETLEASIAHDIFSFGVIIYRIETKQPLFLTNQDDNVVDDDAKYLRNKPKHLLRKKQLNVDMSSDARDLLSKLLHHDPVQRLKYFTDTEYGDGDEMMDQVLKHAYFNQESKFSKQMEQVGQDVKQVGQNVKNIDLKINELTEILKLLPFELKAEIHATKKLLIHAIYDATEVSIPTTFIVLKKKLPGIHSTQEELQTLQENIEQAKEWAIALSDIFTEDSGSKSIAEVIKGRFEKLIEVDTMYFYLIDELTGMPVTAGIYPIEIKKAPEFVPKLMPYILFGMRAMSVYNGAAGLYQMFGIPLPKVPDSIEKNMTESVEILKRKSSVEAFDIVQQKVEDNDDTKSKSARGVDLRQLESFFKKHDSEKNFAGLRRLGGEDGGAVWTEVPDDQLEDLLQQRALMRGDEEKRAKEEAKKQVENEKKLIEEKYIALQAYLDEEEEDKRRRMERTNQCCWRLF